MDDKLREIERRWQSEPTVEVALEYAIALRRTRSKIRLRSFKTAEVGIHVRATRDNYVTVYLVVDTNTDTQCKHKHRSKRNAVKCAKRYAYNHVTSSDNHALLAKYLKIG